MRVKFISISTSDSIEGKINNTIKDLESKGLKIVDIVSGQFNDYTWGILIVYRRRSKFHPDTITKEDKHD